MDEAFFWPSTQKHANFPLHVNFLPPGPVRTGPPVNLCADLTSSSPKNSKHLIWNLSVQPLSITAYPVQCCCETLESCWRGQRVGFSRQVARSSHGWDTRTRRSHSPSLRVINQLTSPRFLSILSDSVGVWPIHEGRDWPLQVCLI